MNWDTNKFYRGWIRMHFVSAIFFAVWGTLVPAFGLWWALTLQHNVWWALIYLPTLGICAFGVIQSGRKIPEVALRWHKMIKMDEHLVESHKKLEEMVEKLEEMVEKHKPAVEKNSNEE